MLFDKCRPKCLFNAFQLNGNKSKWKTTKIWKTIKKGVKIELHPMEKGTIEMDHGKRRKADGCMHEILSIYFPFLVESSRWPQRKSAANKPKKIYSMRFSCQLKWSRKSKPIQSDWMSESEIALEARSCTCIEVQHPLKISLDALDTHTHTHTSTILAD